MAEPPHTAPARPDIVASARHRVRASHQQTCRNSRAASAGQTPELAGTGDIAIAPKPSDTLSLSADAIPLIGTLGKAIEGVIQSEGNASAAFLGSAV
jgi:hypothetical protein